MTSQFLVRSSANGKKRPVMTIAVDLAVKQQIKQTNHTSIWSSLQLTKTNAYRFETFCDFYVRYCNSITLKIGLPDAFAEHRQQLSIHSDFHIVGAF